jgi:amino acid adenylation domain-containing protein
VTISTDVTAQVEDAYPLATLQAGMLFHSEYTTGNATYHDVFTVVVRAHYDREALERALAETVARHPVLRTSFNITDFSEPLQLVHRQVDAPVTELDLTGLAPDDAREALLAWREEEKHRPFGLSAPPLFRVFVHRLPAGMYAATLSFHHAILDGWSVAKLASEMLARYTAQRNGEALSTEPLPVTYRDFVAAELAVIGSAESVAFWRDQVADAPYVQVPRLPGYPTGLTADMAVVETNVDEDVVTGLEGVARALRVPLRTVIFAAHLRVMAMLTGNPEPVCGLVTHGRLEHEAGEHILGLFLNTVPIRVRVDRSSWAELIRAVFAAEIGLLPHRNFPLFEIQRATGRAPIFETLLDYRDFHVYDVKPPPGNRIEFVEQHIFEQTNLPLAAAFSTVRQTGGLALLLPYDRNQFPAAQVTAIRDYHLRALAEIAGDPAGDPRPTASYLVDDVSRIDGWNATATTFTGPATLGGWTAAQVAASPDAPALCFRGRWLSYREFGERVNRLVRHLRDRGVRVGDVVGVCLDRGVDLVVAVHAVVAAGAAYLPLEPSYPDDRLSFMTADAGTRLIITSSIGAKRFPGVDTVRLDDDADEIAARDAAPLDDEPPADAPAYVIYTSGSTGIPKGVAVAHRAIVNRLHWMQQTFPLTIADRVLHKTPFSFDVSVWELFWPLLIGAGLVVADPGGHRDAGHLASLVEDHGVTTIHFVPSMLEALLDEPATAARLGRLRWAICSGEALSPALAERFRAALPAVELHNLYGPTEAAVDVTWHPCAPGETTVPIGRPIANTRIEILDTGGQRAPIGTPGELCIGGVQLALGYLNRPSLTAERFTADPYGEPGSRLYHTGDLARWRPDGEVEYLGRIDQQVKLRGFRIEPGEIEAALTAHPDVRTAVVIVRDDGTGPRLVSYLVAVSSAAGCVGDPPVVADLGGVDFAGHLRDRLPEHMVPSTYVVLDELPMTGNGKLDRAALPAPEAPHRPGYWPPRDQVEARLATVWEQLLGVPAIGIDDDFFDLGGHSLLALRLALRIRQELGRELPVATVLTAPTIRRLAEELRRPEDMGRTSSIVALRTTGDRIPIFLSHALGGQVFRYRPLAARLGDDQPVYTIPARGLAPGEVPHYSLDEMVTDYVSYIREVRPHGPYVLGGFCIGGNIAMEIGRRLRAEGEEVPLVVPVWSSINEPVVSSSLEDETMLMIHALAGGVNVLETVDLDKLRSLSTEERLVAVIQAAANEKRLRPDTADIEQARRYLDVFKANAHAVGYYKHEPYDGDVLYLQPADDPDLIFGADEGWRDIVTGHFALAPVPGTRFTTVYEPLVAKMADQIRRWMDHGFTDTIATGSAGATTRD